MSVRAVPCLSLNGHVTVQVRFPPAVISTSIACGMVRVDQVQGPTDSRSGGGGVGIGAFAEAGRSNVDLLWRVAEVFSPDLTSLLMSAQVRPCCEVCVLRCQMPR